MTGRRAVWLTVIGALLLRLVLLFVRGEYLVYDEGYYLLLARSLRAGHGFSLNGLPHVALSPLQPLLVAGLSLIGVPDLPASRLLAALCGALLVVPVAWLATRWCGARGGITAALFVALCPPLLTFLPFFPGERWNLYFGSEPLYLLLATAAIACGVRAGDDGRWRWWLLTGATAALAYLTRLEGIVLGAALGLAMMVALWRAGRLAQWPRAAAALAAGAVVAAPYLWYLHGALGRWALSGRVQAAAAAGAEAPPVAHAADSAAGGSDAVREFVWGGNTAALWRTLYALNDAGTQMASQYWGVPGAEPARAGSALPGPADTAAGAPRTTDAGRPRDSALAAAAGPAPPPATVPATSSGPARTLVRAILVVVPLWFLVLALGGLAFVRPRADAALFLAPMAVASLAPALLAYPEPRALLMLVPAACILAAATSEQARRLGASHGRAWLASPLVPALVAMWLAIPTARDLVRAWGQQTPLQQVSAARRVVGEYVGGHLPADARIVSWHPAIAIWARRDWRVLPYDSFERIVGYARAQRAETIVFSRFDPSPLNAPPRAFTAVLIDSASAGSGGQLRLDQVAATPVLFVGRLAPAPVPPPR